MIKLAVESFHLATKLFISQKYKAAYMALRLSFWFLLGCPKDKLK